MTALIIIAIVVAWLACGALGAGYYFAYYQREYPGFRKRDFEADKSHAIGALWFGPCALLTARLLDRRAHGWLWPWSVKARKEAGIES